MSKSTNHNKTKGRTFKGRSTGKPSCKPKEMNSANDAEVKGNNDPAWYALNPALLRDAASIPFSWSNGTPIEMNNANFPNGLFIPGILTLELSPSVGYSSKPSDPINIASTAIYSFVRHANSGHSNYDSTDLMLYLLAMSSVYSYINFLMRAYGMATMYAQRNRYLPRGLMASNYIDFNDVNTRLADFRYGINVLIHKAASLAVPANMTLFTRHAFLYQNIYTEGTSIKDQLYMYTPSSFLQFQLDTDGAGMLKQVQYAGTLHTVDQLIDYGSKLLDPILASEDMNIMSGDILKAYGDNIIKLMELPSSYPLVPVFNIGVLEQMKNAFITPATNMDIKQSAAKSYLLHEPKVAWSADWANSYRILTTTSADVTPELVIESTRLMSGTKSVGTNEAEVYCGSELVTWAKVWVMTPDGNVVGNDLNFEFVTNANNITMLQYLSNFRYHPWVVTNVTDSADIVLFDVDNYAVLTAQDIKRLHESALLSQLYVPSIGRL